MTPTPENFSGEPQVRDDAETARQIISGIPDGDYLNSDLAQVLLFLLDRTPINRV